MGAQHATSSTARGPHVQLGGLSLTPGHARAKPVTPSGARSPAGGPGVDGAGKSRQRILLPTALPFGHHQESGSDVLLGRRVNNVHDPVG